MSRALDAALVLGEPVEPEWAQATHALTQGERPRALIHYKGGWRRGASVTPDDPAPMGGGVGAAPMALQRL